MVHYFVEESSVLPRWAALWAPRAGPNWAYILVIYMTGIYIWWGLKLAYWLGLWRALLALALFCRCPGDIVCIWIQTAPVSKFQQARVHHHPESRGKLYQHSLDDASGDINEFFKHAVPTLHRQLSMVLEAWLAQNPAMV